MGTSPGVSVSELQTSQPWMWPQKELEAQTSEQGDMTHRRPVGLGGGFGLTSKAEEAGPVGAAGSAAGEALFYFHYVI